MSHHNLFELGAFLSARKVFSKYLLSPCSTRVRKLPYLATLLQIHLKQSRFLHSGQWSEHLKSVKDLRCPKSASIQSSACRSGLTRFILITS